MKVILTLFYLLLLLLPIQLGKHFFFDFSYIYGIRSDYLTPTFYFTDFIILAIIFKFLSDKTNFTGVLKNKGLLPACLFLAYLFFVCVMGALNKWAAFYLFLKILEFFLLGIVIVRAKPDIFKMVLFLSGGVFYSSLIALWQFFIKSSIGGVFWFLGERTFNLYTPDIAVSYILGTKQLRPYSTFPHPNVLGGFLAISLIMIIFYQFKLKNTYKKIYLIWRLVVSLLGITVLFLTQSRAAWIVFSLGLGLVFIIKKKLMKKRWITTPAFILVFYLVIFLLTVLLFLSPFHEKSIVERVELAKLSFTMILEKPLFGVGLNNFINHVKLLVPFISELYLIQPVHNIYLLVLSETGFIGLFFVLIGISWVFYKNKKAHPLVFVFLSQILILGVFDHYLVTLQQGMLFLTVVASLAFLPKNA